MICNTSEKLKLGGAQEKCKGALKISYSANNDDHSHYNHDQNMENKCNKAHTSHKNPDHMYFILLKKKSCMSNKSTSGSRSLYRCNHSIRLKKEEISHLEVHNSLEMQLETTVD